MGDARLCAGFVRYERGSPKKVDGPYKENAIHPLLRDHKIFLILVQGPSPLAGDPSNM